MRTVDYQTKTHRRTTAARIGGDSALPFDLPDLALRIDASDTSTISLIGSKIAQIDDKSGLGNHMSQGVDSARPNNLSTINGLTAMDFDGGDSLASTLRLDNTDYSIFALIEKQGSGKHRYFMGADGAAAVGQRLYVGNRSDVLLRSSHHGNGVDLSVSSYTSGKAIYIVHFSQTGGLTIKFKRGGSLLTGKNSGATIPLTTTRGLELGRGGGYLHWSGLIGEVIVIKNATQEYDDTVISHFENNWGAT